MFTGNSFHIIARVSLTVQKWQLKCALNDACRWVFTSQRARRGEIGELSLSLPLKSPKQVCALGANTLERNHPEDERVPERHSSGEDKGPVLIKPFLFLEPASQPGGGRLISSGFGSPR